MTTQRRIPNGRFSSPIIGLHHRADGTRLDDGQDPEVLDRLERIFLGWRILSATGDRSVLVQLGILPEAE